jgi:hypothetical protein
MYWVACDGHKPVVFAMSGGAGGDRRLYGVWVLKGLFQHTRRHKRQLSRKAGSLLSFSCVVLVVFFSDSLLCACINLVIDFRP